jgi:O-methyltransferase involved in polyketide biosynthesis
MEKDNFEKKSGYKKIGPTAWGVAYYRSQAGIKYAQEIFDELDVVVKPADPLEIEYLQHIKETKMVPPFEARYKLINRLIVENKSNQILEIASGLSPRGLMMTEEDQSLCYVEVDIPAMAENKRRILRNLFDKNKAKPQKNLHIEDGDALYKDSLMSAVRYFENEPITVVNEGLLRYMSFDQKAVIAKNIHDLLEKFDGVWITSDITVARMLEGRDEGKLNRKLIQALSGIDVEKNTFKDVEAAAEFFENTGFAIEKHSFLEAIDELASPKNLYISANETRRLLEHAVIFVMRLKD